MPSQFLLLALWYVTLIYKIKELYPCCSLIIQGLVDRRRQNCSNDAREAFGESNIARAISFNRWCKKSKERVWWAPFSRRNSLRRRSANSQFTVDIEEWKNEARTVCSIWAQEADFACWSTQLDFDLCSWTSRTSTNSHEHKTRAKLPFVCGASLRSAFTAFQVDSIKGTALKKWTTLKR